MKPAGSSGPTALLWIVLGNSPATRIATPAADANVAHSASAVVSGPTGCILGLVATGSTEHLRQLHAECVGALREYIHQAEKTCELLRSIPEFPLSMEHRYPHPLHNLTAPGSEITERAV
jgi:hypothetical protein